MAVGESSARRYALSDPDVRLMLAVRDNDDAGAFEELMRRYQTRLVTVLEHLVGNRETAEDLAQETFLRIYRSRKRYVPGSKFSTWLFTIANNAASNARRSRARRKERNITPATDETGAWGAGGLEGMAQEKSAFMPTRQADKAEMRDVVRKALEQLNERQRMAVLLCKFENLSYVEISEAMGMSPQAIKSLLSRARVNLREAIEPYLQSGANPGPAAEATR